MGLFGGPSEYTRAAYLVPREVVLITGEHEGDEALWPVDLHMPVALEPPFYALSCRTEAFGARVVLASGVFVVNFMPAAEETKVIEAGALSGAGAAKRARLGLAVSPARFVRAPRLDAADGWIEATVHEVRRYGDRSLIVGRVVHAETRPRGPRTFHEWRR